MKKSIFTFVALLAGIVFAEEQIINGQKCLVIPMDEDEHAAINGVNTTI